MPPAFVLPFFLTLLATFTSQGATQEASQHSSGSVTAPGAAAVTGTAQTVTVPPEVTESPNRQEQRQAGRQQLQNSNDSAATTSPPPTAPAAWQYPSAGLQWVSLITGGAAFLLSLTNIFITYRYRRTDKREQLSMRKAALLEEYRNKIRDATEQLVFWKHQCEQRGLDLWGQLTHGPQAPEDSSSATAAAAAAGDTFAMAKGPQSDANLKLGSIAAAGSTSSADGAAAAAAPTDDAKEYDASHLHHTSDTPASPTSPQAAGAAAETEAAAAVAEAARIKQQSVIDEMDKERERYLSLRKAYNIASAFWDKVLVLIQAQQLPADFLLEGSADNAGKGWLHRANHFRENLEPFCIANYYRLGFNSTTGPYAAVRPDIFMHIEDMYIAWASARGCEEYIDSTVWAQNADNGCSNSGVAPLRAKKLKGHAALDVQQDVWQAS